MDQSTEPPTVPSRDQSERLVEQAAALVGLPLLPEHRSGVIENFERIAQVAALVIEFPLPEAIAPDFQFEP